MPRSMIARHVLSPILLGSLSLPAAVAEARPRRMSAAQVKKIQEEMQYRQQEVIRYQNAVAEKEREIYLSYDENGNGRLEGAELAKYRKYVTTVQNGEAPDPFAAIPLPGQGPRGSGKK